MTGTVYSHIVEFLQKYDSADHITLDIGCGSGAYAKYLKSRYVGIEIQRSNYGGRGPTVLGDAQKMPFRSNSVDLAFAVGVLYQISDVDSALLEIYRVLKNRAHFIAFDYNKATTRRLKKIENVKSNHIWSPWGLANRLRYAGFKTKIVWDCTPAPDVQWKRRLTEFKLVRLFHFLESQFGEGWNVIIGTKD